MDEDTQSAILAVSDLMGSSVGSVPNEVVTAEGIPWSMHKALRIAYIAGRQEGRDDSR